MADYTRKLDKAASGYLQGLQKPDWDINKDAAKKSDDFYKNPGKAKSLETFWGNIKKSVGIKK